MTARSDDRVVFVTGANRGIGYHMVTALAREGYRVAALDVDGDQVGSVRDDFPDRVRYYECDVTEDDAVDRAVAGALDRWGRIDVLVNNAAVASFAPFDRQAPADTRREFEVNVFGYLRTIRAVLPHMLDRDDGIVHNVGSATAAVGHPGLAGYAATKGAIAALTRSLRLELRRTGVTCTVMVPPTTDTRMSAELGYPEWMLADPAAVGRKLAGKVESTDAVITPDRQTSIGLSLIRRFPRLWATIVERYVDPDG